jgi:ABC-2 type transport system permease protein
MKILNLAIKDLSQILREKRTLLFLVAMPVVFTFFMGLSYRSADNNEVADNRIPLAVVDSQPEAMLNKALHARLDSSEALKPVDLSKAEALDALSQGKVDGVLLIPDGFSPQAMEGKTASLSLIAEPTSMQGQALYQLLRGPVSQLMSAVEISQEAANVVGAQKAVEPSVEQKAAFELAWEKWEANSHLSLVDLRQAAGQKSDDPYGGNPYNQSSPGILVQFAIFGLVTSAQILVQERKTRTLQRLMTTGMKTWEIVAGHMLAMFVLVFLQMTLLVAFGQWVLKVDYLSQPLGTLLVIVALGLWVAAMGLFIGIQAKGEEQVILFSLIAMFLFSALGGTWFSLESAGGAFAAIGRLTPSAWAMNGLQNILIRGLGLASVGQPVVILLAYALGFFALAMWRFRKMEL